MQQPTTFSRNSLTLDDFSIAVSKEDLAEIVRLCVQSIDEAKEIEIEALKQGEESDEAFERGKATLRENYSLTVSIESDTGVQLIGPGTEVFEYEEFPKRVVSFYANSGSALKMLSYTPRNEIEIYFDFSLPKHSDFSAWPSRPTQNASRIHVNGLDATWVRGVFKGIRDLIDERQKTRHFLHRGGAYDIFLWLLWIPFAFWTCSLAAPLVNSLEPAIHKGAVYAG